ncbi:type I CRISPR-associated protein Cas7 [Sulfuracidifex tepidarius]|uniref:type I CRISPR-associated protein Cas7 n=1 Tax=Sulfuracidifex tepidarius TaxID=1294262 RepID=UPI0034E236B1
MGLFTPPRGHGGLPFHHFPLLGRDTGYGNIGKDYRVYYSMIAFHGAVSAKRAEVTNASEEDLKKLDDYLWNSLVTETVTRSKIGQRPLLYLRVEYSSPEAMKGDLRRFVSVKEKGESVRDFSDLEVDLTPLLNLVKGNDVVRVHVKCSEEFTKFCEEVKKTGKGSQ